MIAYMVDKTAAEAIKAKYSAFSRYSYEVKSNFDYANYKTKCNRVKFKLRTAQLSYEQSLLKYISVQS